MEPTILYGMAPRVGMVMLARKMVTTGASWSFAGLELGETWCCGQAEPVSELQSRS